MTIFEDRYLNFSSEITKELYREIYNALMSEGYSDCDDGFEQSWNYFNSRQYGILTDYTKQASGRRGEKCICTTSSPCGKDISLSALLSQIRGESYVIVNKETFFPKVEEIL